MLWTTSSFDHDHATFDSTFDSTIDYNMWFTIQIYPDGSTPRNLFVFVGSDGNIYFRATEIFKLVTRVNPWKLCKRCIPSCRTVSMVLQRGIPTAYPHMKILTFGEAISILKLFPGGMADYLLDVFTTARVTQVGTRYGQSGLFYCSNPSKSAVYQVVQQESHDESVAIEDLIQAARSKFMEFYSRLAPKTRNDSRNMDETLRNDSHNMDETSRNDSRNMDETPNSSHEMDDEEGDLVIVTDDEELERMSQPKQIKPIDVFKTYFPSVPKEIHWCDGKATNTFRCERYYVKGKNFGEDLTLHRAEQAC
ncbi:hypothetical protein AVEN_33810-1 [Araneus ventricosus]|uniref:Uncharacterized protein n=1 Tax=Araneus ventricosus TaxID=182803 RepID=A0A4Y2NRG3_ARAVE|nr:hypothetical protein AVEN_33810-1 [Araneus ventricosus]